MNPSAIVQEVFGYLPTATTLMDVAAKSAILLLLVTLLSPCWRKASAAARHALWLGALGGALMLTIFSFGLPRWHAAWRPHWNSAATSSESVTQPRFFAAAATFSGVETNHANNLSASSPPGFISTPAKSITVTASTSRLAHLAEAIWLLGSMLALLPVLTGWFLVARLTRRGRPLNTPAWNALLAETASAMSVRLPIRVITTRGLNLPFTWGTFRPVVLFPETAEAWPDARRRLVLLHELGHVKRLDCFTQTLGSLACAMHWFNPLAWLAARQMRLTREQACDDLVLRSGQSPKDYARELLELAVFSRPDHLLNLAAVPMARRCTLEARLRAILDAKRKRASLSAAFALAALALTVALSLPLAMLYAAPDADAEAPRSLPTDQDVIGGPIVEWPDTAGGNNHFYQAVAVPNGINWPDAEALALAHGGYLATIGSAVENDFVFSLIDYPELWLNDAAGNSRGPWLGGLKSPSSTAPDKGWQWLLDKGPIIYADWADPVAQHRRGDRNRTSYLGYYAGGKNQSQPTWSGAPKNFSVLGFVVEYDTDPEILTVTEESSAPITTIVVHAPDASAEPKRSQGTAPATSQHIALPGQHPGPLTEWPVAVGGNGHFFEVVETPLGINWADARSSAIVRGGHLATITSSAENDFIFNLLDDPKYWIINHPYNDRNLGPWLGGCRLPTASRPDQDWVWISDGSKITYTNWAPTEPDDGGLGNEDKLQFMSFTPGDRQPTWNDVGGEYMLHGYVVEFDSDPTATQSD